MTIEVNAATVGIIIVILTHEAAVIWWASTISLGQKHLHECMHRLRDELLKRDEQIGTLWKRIDEIRDMVISRLTSQNE